MRADVELEVRASASSPIDVVVGTSEMFVSRVPTSSPSGPADPADAPEPLDALGFT